MSDCGVCIGYEGGDFSALWDEVIRTARKPHKCGDCGRTIQPGERYELISSLYDGSWSKYKTCHECAEIADAFMCNGRVVGQLWDLMWDAYPALNTACYERLSTPAAKAELQRRWMVWKFSDSHKREARRRVEALLAKARKQLAA